MSDGSLLFITLGGTFLLGLAADFVGRRTPIPRVTLLLVLGFVVGPSGLALLAARHEIVFERGSEIALTMVGFLLGERLVHSMSQGEGGPVLWIAAGAVVVTAVVVTAGLWAIGAGLSVALLLAGIATATAPAATVDVVKQAGAKGPFTDTLLGVVAVDDALGLLGFSVLMAVAKIVGGAGGDVAQPLLDGAWELGGALLIGGLLGGVMSYLTGRIAPGEPSLLEALGFVFLACGIAQWAGVSFILTAMVMGAAVARLATHHHYPFHEVELIEQPFMILFFVLAGASVDLRALWAIGWMGGAYVLLRTAGRLVGGWLGGWLAGAKPHIRRGIGLALLPQAGVALGMALLAEHSFPAVGSIVLQIAIGSTVLFELVGPVLTRIAVTRAGAFEVSADPT